MFVLAYYQVFFAFLWDGDRCNLIVEHTVGLRSGCTLLAAQREGILVRAADGELLRHIFGGLGH